MYSSILNTVLSVDDNTVLSVYFNPSKRNINTAGRRTSEVGNEGKQEIYSVSSVGWERVRFSRKKCKSPDSVDSRRRPTNGEGNNE